MKLLDTIPTIFAVLAIASLEPSVQRRGVIESAATPAAVQVVPDDATAAVTTIATAPAQEAVEPGAVSETHAASSPVAEPQATYVMRAAPNTCGPNGCYAPRYAAQPRTYQRQTYRTGPVRRLFGRR